MSSKLAIGILLAGIFSAANATGKEPRPTPKSVGDGVICQCGGCNQTVSTCNHYECSARAEMNSLIQKEIAAGKDETTILQDFVLRYGVEVLASPPAKGFNLAVWALPGVGLLLGLAVVAMVVRRWRNPSGASASAPTAPIDPKLLAAMEEEMKSTGLGGRI